jgi:hypothetical protein
LFALILFAVFLLALAAVNLWYWLHRSKQTKEERRLEDIVLRDAGDW